MTGAGGGDLNIMLRGILLLWGEAAKYTALHASNKFCKSSVSEAIITCCQKQVWFQSSQGSTLSDQLSKVGYVFAHSVLLHGHFTRLCTSLNIAFIVMVGLEMFVFLNLR